MNLKNDFVPGNTKSLIFTIVVLFIYFGILINVNFIVEIIVSFISDPEVIISQVSEQQEILKLKVQTFLLSISTSIVFIIIGFVCIQVITCGNIPPSSVNFPFGMVRISGRDALLVGYLGFSISALIIILNIYRIFDVLSLIGYEI